MTTRTSSGFLDLVKTFLYAGLIALVIRTFLFEPFNIPSGSMVPTLLIGDYLFVSKYAYGYSRHALPFSLPLIPGRIFPSMPERGDVVVFKLPSDQTTDYIKRVIGLPGDTVQVIDGVLHLNGEAVEREPDGNYVDYGPFGSPVRYQEYVEILPDGRRHEIIERSDTEGRSLDVRGTLRQGLPDNTGVYVVPEGHFFAMGDNRDNSKDSRYPSVGFVPFENLVGRAEIIFFSIDGSLLKFWAWVDTIRGSRIFKLIE